MISNHTMSVDKVENPKDVSEHEKVMDLDSVTV